MNQSNFQTPLAKVKGHGSARHGTGHFRQQRLTAVANIPLMAFLLWLVFILAGKSHAEVSACLATAWVATLLILSLASMFYHMQLGMQIILEDYIHNKFGALLLMANKFFCIFLFVVGVVCIFRNMFFNIAIGV